MPALVKIATKTPTLALENTHDAASESMALLYGTNMHMR
jgi:hypothetical protein